MSSINFKIVDVDLDIGVCTVEIDLPNGGKHTASLDPTSFATSAEATELELVNGISDQVVQVVDRLFPKAPPKPEALIGMVGNQYSTRDY